MRYISSILGFERPACKDAMIGFLASARSADDMHSAIESCAGDASMLATAQAPIATANPEGQPCTKAINRFLARAPFKSSTALNSRILMLYFSCVSEDARAAAVTSGVAPESLLAANSDRVNRQHHKMMEALERIEEEKRRRDEAQMQSNRQSFAEEMEKGDRRFAAESEREDRRDAAEMEREDRRFAAESEREDRRDAAEMEREDRRDALAAAVHEFKMAHPEVLLREVRVAALIEGARRRREAEAGR